jgi:hypothetical protein
MIMRRWIALLVCVVAVTSVGSAAEMTTVLVFQLADTSLDVGEVTAAVQPLLSESGSLTVQPHQQRIIVQDRPDVVVRVSEVLDRMKSAPERFILSVELLEASNTPLPQGQQAAVDDRIRRTFRYTSFRTIGMTLIEGQLGNPGFADLGSGYQVRFVPDRLPSPDEFPWGISTSGARIHLDRLSLTSSPPGVAGAHKPTEILRTSVVLGPSQRAIFGASASEGSDRALVLILTARSIGDG